MNTTKWNELRLAMHAITPGPGWQTVATNGYVSAYDVDWLYHFRIGPYKAIKHVDIFVTTPDQRAAVRAALKAIHVPGEETTDGFRVFGYLHPGQAVDYL